VLYGPLPRRSISQSGHLRGQGSQGQTTNTCGVSRFSPHETWAGLGPGVRKPLSATRPGMRFCVFACPILMAYGLKGNSSVTSSATGRCDGFTRRPNGSSPAASIGPSASATCMHANSLQPCSATEGASMIWTPQGHYMGYGKQSCYLGFAGVRAVVNGGPTPIGGQQDPIIRCCSTTRAVLLRSRRIDGAGCHNLIFRTAAIYNRRRTPCAPTHPLRADAPHAPTHPMRRRTPCAPSIAR
jgi:hypothetical protein